MLVINATTPMHKDGRIA